jgi:uncharacterized tellurite resistance protein B-like protein
MEGKQIVYYALGILAYAVAKSDGEIQVEEKDRLNEILEKELDHNLDFQYAEIIFQLLDQDGTKLSNVYEWAMTELKKGRHYLDEESKKKMIFVMREVSRAFGSVTSEESGMIRQFEEDLKSLH